MAWSFWARQDAIDREQAGEPPPECGRRSCTYCPHYALEWREKALRSCEAARPEPLALFDL